MTTNPWVRDWNATRTAYAKLIGADDVFYYGQALHASFKADPNIRKLHEDMTKQGAYWWMLSRIELAEEKEKGNAGNA